MKGVYLKRGNLEWQPVAIGKSKIKSSKKMVNSYSLLVFIVIWCMLWKQCKQDEDANCIHKCGNISIPYPFGIGSANSKCYFNSSFEVMCKSNIAILKKLNLEIVEVNMDRSVIIVKFPSITACNGTEIKWRSPDLKGSPFRYFLNYYKIISIGCDGYAFLKDSDGNIIRGCTSTCAPDTQSLEAGKQFCYGFGKCCQLDISDSHSRHRGIIISVVSIDSGSKNCRSVFITDSKSFVSPNTAFNVTLKILLPHRGQDGRLKTFLILALGYSLLACYFIGLLWLLKTSEGRREIKLRKKYFNGKLQEHIINQEEVEKTKLFTEKEVKKSTENFSEDRIIGKGGQGTVYKGMLSGGKLVAVKKSISLGETNWKELINEVIILSNVNHRNVIKLLGCCLETQSLLLVYEFIPNGTLSELIHDPNEEFQLTWATRLRIASEVAGAIAYLHSSCSTPIYHRDIKTSNILLDHDYRAKVCDFGLSRLISTDQTHITTLIRGTFGYFDPEFFRSNQFTDKSDVYSFGVVLVEMITGKKPIIVTPDNTTSLVTEFMSLTDDSAMIGMLDPVIVRGSDNVIDDIMVVVNLAKCCLNPIGVERPTMMQVAMKLACLNQKEVAKSTSSKDKSSTSEHA